MDLPPEELFAWQCGFMLFMLGSYEYGARDPFWFGMRTAGVIAYSIAMTGDQRAWGTVADWVCQTFCLCHYITVVTNLFNPTLRWRRKDA